MDEDTDFDEAVVDIDEVDDATDFAAKDGGPRHDVRRKIEEMLERKRLREEFGDLDDF